MIANVNWMAILASAVATMVVGYFWYGKMLFGKTWMKEAGVSESQMNKSNMPTMYIAMFIAAVVEAYVLSVILGFMGQVTYMTAAVGAFWVWLGFVATTMIGAVLAEGRSWTYYAIVAGYQLVVLVIMSAILVAL